MQLKQAKINSKRLASISALGAGALALAAPDAQAGIIHYDINQTVGFSPTSSASYTINTLPGVARITVARQSWSFGASTTSFRVAAQATAGYARFRLNFVSSGKTWNNSIAMVTVRGLGTKTTSGSDLSYEYSVAKQYFLFEFQDSTQGNAMRYGWGHVNLAFNPSHKPDVTLLDYAFDNTGAYIAAGDTGVPEPSSLALSGLGALVLGAAGIRRWRKTATQ